MLVAIQGCDRQGLAPPRPRLEVADVLGAEAVAGFARAYEPRALVFPADHGPHSDFLSEWWYFTGNLRENDARWGYQLTFFRTSLAPPSARPATPSRWRADQVYMGHFAVSDIEAQRFFAFDRFQRGAFGLAGAEASPWRVWLDDWELEQLGEDPFPLRLRATGGSGDGRVSIDLHVAAGKPIVLQGDQGLSQKGPSPGNASYYYSFTRLPTTGSIEVDSRRHPVQGDSWLDREWSTSVLESGQVGWDWFALQLSDGTELMVYQLRDAEGRPGGQSGATFIDVDGRKRALSADAFELEALGTWQSPIDGTSYPSGWTVTVPGLGIALSVDVLLDNQELDVAFRYWEGAVSVSGTGAAGRPVSGHGYVELTGYAEAAGPP